MGSFALVFAAGAALLAGCQSPPPRPTEAPLSTPFLGPLPTASTGAAWALPLIAYATSPAEQKIITKADGLLIRACMRRLGFTAWQAPPPAESSTQWNTGLRIGIVDASLAARYGYHPPGPVDTRRRSNTSSPHERAEVAALSGDQAAATVLPGKQIPDGGCSGEADRALRSGVPAYDRQLYGRLSEQADQATQVDKRAVEAVRAWSACMKPKGYEYRNPWEASDQTWAVNPTRAEKDLAIADVACKQQTGLPAIWFATVSGYQQQLIDRNRASLRAMRTAVEAGLRKADAVLASGG